MTTAGAAQGTTSAPPFSRARTRASSASRLSASQSTERTLAPGSRPSTTASAAGARSRGTGMSWSISTPIGSRDAACTPPGRSTGTSATLGACSCWTLPRFKFSYLLVPDALCTHKYRIGETPDGRLCMVTDAEEQLQLWVRSDARSSDNGWILEKTIVDLRVVCDEAKVPAVPMYRNQCAWPTDMDAGRTGKVFIETWGFGRYSFHMDTGKIERLSTERGKDYGHPIFAYFLSWPPAFLAPEY